MAKKDLERVAPATEEQIIEGSKEASKDTPDKQTMVIQSDADTDQSNGISIEDVAPVAPVPAKQPFVKWFWHWLLTHKKIAIPGFVVVVLGVLAAVPFTRYALAGLVLRQQFTVTVVDVQTNQPVSSATVELAGKKALTDGRGNARLHVPVGQADVAVSKKYFKNLSQSVLVPIGSQKAALQIRLQATGRQVPVAVVNKITKKAVAGATILALDTEAKTDKQGKATVVIPADKQTVTVTIKASGYNDSLQTLQVTTQAVAANDFAIIPEGKVHFLSNKSGKIDVIASNLDGSEREVVLAGTGREVRDDTALLASRDWKYLALYARRDSEKPKLYLIETATGKLTTMDEGAADFTLIGWKDHSFVYTVTRTQLKDWEPKRQAIKSYNAPTQKITTLDETKAEGGEVRAVYERIGQAYVVDNEIVYPKYWHTYTTQYYLPYPNVDDKQITLNTVQADGKAKKVIKGYATRTSQGNQANVVLRLRGADGLYVLYDTYEADSVVEEYTSGQLHTAAAMKRGDFYNSSYTTYLISPSGDMTAWSDSRDGKSALFVGNKQGDDGKQLVALPAEYYVYGWYGDSYMLVSKNGNELYILSGSEAKDEQALLKVSDYYRSGGDYRGYGGGYGGL
jgi:hypothetical protein